MATNYDFKAPVTVTVTAIARKVVDGEEVRTVMEDAGSKTGPFAADPAYLIDSIQIPLYKSNIVKEIEPGDSITISAKSSNEVAHYLALADVLAVTVAATAESSEDSEDDGGEG